MHYGHILYFREAKKLAKKIILSVTSDQFVNKGPDRPYNKLYKRIELLSSIIEIDHIVVNSNNNALNHIKAIKPDFYIKGKDYKNLDNDITENIKSEKRAVNKFGGKFIVTNSELFSSSNIINKEKQRTNPILKKFLNKLDNKKLIKKINFNFKKKIKSKILVIGEPIIDNFISIKYLGKSSKSDIISTTKIGENIKYGGIFLVAEALSKYIEKIDLLLPKSQHLNYSKILPKNINKIFLNLRDYKKIIKNRFVNQYNQNLTFQLNENDMVQFSQLDSKKISSKILYLNKINNYDKIVLFDYGHGLLNKDVISGLKSLKKKLLVNCQSNSSNYGFNTIDKYFDSNTICIDEDEFRLSVQDKVSSINDLIKKNKKTINKFNNFLVTMGKYGCFIMNKTKKPLYIPTIIENLKNTIGAGDIFYCYYIISELTKKFDKIESGLIAHLGAGIYLNNKEKKIIEKNDFIKFSQSLLK